MSDIVLPAALTAAALCAAGTYLMLSRNVQRVTLGFLLLANGVNLGLLASCGLPNNSSPPILSEPGKHVDPLPQAFLLTAIVIGLGTSAFLLAFAVRIYHDSGSDHIPGEET